jgi:hypothetical protein
MKAGASAQSPKQDPHRSLHSEIGALPGEHPGWSKDPLIRVAGLAWLEVEKPDLEAAERFLTDFGFTVADRTPEMLLLRGRWAGPACLVVRRGPGSRFAGVAFAAAARGDLDRLARRPGSDRGGRGADGPRARGTAGSTRPRHRPAGQGRRYSHQRPMNRPAFRSIPFPHTPH